MIIYFLIPGDLIKDKSIILKKNSDILISRKKSFISNSLEHLKSTDVNFSVERKLVKDVPYEIYTNTSCAYKNVILSKTIDNESKLKIFIRKMSTKAPFVSSRQTLTHIDNEGKAKMVDVGDKIVSVRTAKAKAEVCIGEEASELIQQNLMKKGDVLTVAQLAGIMGAKKTSELIPLCHNINLSQVKIDIKLDPNTHTVIIITSVKSEGKTGVEMEALTGCSIAALTVYDMCKAVNKGIIIRQVYLLEKTGGEKGNYLIDES